MIKYSKHILDNGLTVVIHEDPNTPMAVVNTLYDVGSRDESEDKTGFAHLFEHLMFGGSQHIGSFDEPLQQVGGDNNAFTSLDITNYYVTIPAANIETAFWLESDRMLSLSFDPNVLEVQRKVVIEEFKQRYLNQPYGDVWLHLRPLAYEVHPYKWPTIGKDITHIEQATMEDVKSFFYRHYAPNNATLVIAGNVDADKIVKKVEKWYGDIPARPTQPRSLPPEPTQTHYRRKVVESDVPAHALYMTFHMPGRTDNKYHTTDLLSDLLGRGHSAWLQTQLVKKQKIFSNAAAYITGSHDPGLLVINGKLNPGISIEKAEDAVWDLLNMIKSDGIPDEVFEKLINQAESSHLMGETELLNRGVSLAVSTVLGDTDLINKEIDVIKSIDKPSLMQQAEAILKPENCSVLHFLSRSAN